MKSARQTWAVPRYDGDDSVRPSTVLQALKLCLGAAGRGDFDTRSSDVPGDIIYRDEAVAVFVTGCLWMGCPKHGAPKASNERTSYKWVRVAERNKTIRDKHLVALAQSDWKAVEFWECEIAADPRGCAERVIAILEARRPVVSVKMRAKQDLDLAQIARLDANTRFTDVAWCRAVEIIVNLEPMGQFMMGDVVDALKRDGLNEAQVSSVWNTLVWHEIVSRRERGYYEAGPLLGAEAELLGVKSGVQR